MALRFVDGFEGYGAAAATGATLETAVKYFWPTSASTVMLLATGWGGIGLCLDANTGTGSSGRYLGLTLDAQATWTIGFAFKAPNPLPDFTRHFLSWRSGADADANAQITLALTQGGQFQIIRGVSGTGTILGTTDKGVKQGRWYYLELKITFDNSAGAVELRMDGEAWYNQSSLDTTSVAANSADRIHLSMIGWVGLSCAIDDLYICDGTGTTCNSFLGPLKVETSAPTADSTPLQWNASSGTNHVALIDEVSVAPNTSDYVYETTSADEDRYDVANLAVVTANIQGVQLNAVAALSAAGSMSLLLPVTSGAATSNGSNITVNSTTYTGKFRVLEQDPNTNAAWATANVNAAQIGVKVA
ncbi:MAG: hypothetical protein AMXMBFR16_10350 [Candidatus Uhrbacteria bacterium]